MGRRRSVIVTAHVPCEIYEKMRRLVAEGKYPNLSEVVRAALRRFFADDIKPEARRWMMYA